MDKIKQIGFKAGEKPKRPVIQADTSASKSYASIAYGISEGEIVGLIDGAKSVLLDGTPVMSTSGDINIPDVTIQERKGTNDQTHLEGFPAVVNEKQYNNIEMLFSAPFVHYINDTNLDAVGIRFTFGALQRTDPDSGDVSGITIEYAIDVQVDGQGYQELLRTNIVGKYSAGYQRYHRVELPPAEEGWEVRIRRLSPNSTSTYIADEMYLDAVAEILDVKMRYPNTALIGLKFDSERFSNIPKVDFRMRGKIIRVPANYNPVTRTYAQSGEGTTNGIWNGQFKMAYTTNPAWIFYDLVLNKRYGLGNRIDPSMLDKWSLYSIAQYCDVMVPDGEGGLEPRFTCNVYINNRFEAYDCLMQLAGVFRGIMYWSGTAIIAGCDRPQDPVFTYTRANIIGEFNYSGTRTRDRHSVVMVSFDDPKNNYKTDKEVVSDRKAISEIGVRTKDLAAFACTSRGQAQRAGKWALFKEQLETRIVTFALGMDGYIAPVGRVIEIADPLLAGRAVGGRIAAVSADKKTITLDRDTTVKVGDRLVLNNEEGEQESRQVSSVSGRNVTVTVAFDSPAVQHVWAVDSDDLQLMRFTVISVTENRSQDGITFTVTALQHEPALHEVADYSAYIERNNYSVIDITTQKAPAEVLISSNNRINQGIDITDLVISWKQAENAVKYHVQWRRDDGNWMQMPFQYGNQVTIENIYHGVYEAKVVAINAAEVNSLPTSSLPTPINSKFAEPAALASLTATGILFGVELNWKFPLYGAQNAAYVEIYWAINADKGDEKLLGSYAYPTTETTLNGLSPHQIIHFRARLVDRNGIASEYTPWVTATVIADPDKLLDILNGHIGLAAIDAELSKAIEDNTTGAADAKALANQAQTAADNAQTTATNAANAVAKEVTDRVAAVTAEANARTAAINKEATDRATALSAQATTLKADSAAKVKALKDEVDPKILTLQNGITKVTTDYKAADTAVVGQLNAYKTSNDTAVASVLQKAESAVATGATNSSAITAINGQITTINSTKLDASVISGYYTKGQTDAKAAEIAAGKVEEYNAGLVIGGVNQLINSESERTASPREYMMYENSVHLKDFYDDNLGKDVTVSFDLKVPVAGPVQVYCSNGTHHTFSASVTVAASDVDKWVRRAVTVKPVKKAGAEAVTRSGLEFYGIYDTGRFPSVRKVQLESGNKATAWAPSPRDTQAALDANSTAIQNTNAEVSRVDGVATAANNATTALSGRVSTVEGAVATKAEAAALTALTTRVTNAEGVNTSQGSAITTLQNTVNHATTGLATKASTSALTATNSEVSRVNGVVTGHAGQLTQLAADITTINGTLATKANAAALNDIYTKTQTDAKATEIAAGEVSKYDASLVIGGTNLYRNARGAEWLDLVYGTGYYSVLYFSVLLDRTKKYTVSFEAEHLSGAPVRAVLGLSPGPNQDAHMELTAFSVGITAGKHSITVDMSKLVITGTFPEGTPVYLMMRLRNERVAANIRIRYIQVEEGSKATTWSPSPEDVQSSLAANATAINTTNTEVARVDGKTTVNANNISGLTSRMGTVEGQVSTKAEASALQNYYTKSEAAANATTVAAGEVAKYNASLKIGSKNLLTSEKWKTPAISSVNKANGYEFTLVDTTSPYTGSWGMFGTWADLELGTQYVFSFKIKALDNTPLSVGGHAVGINSTGADAVYLDGVKVEGSSFHSGTPVVIPNDGKYHLVVVLMTKNTGGADSIYIQPNRLTSYTQPYNCSVKEVMLTEGNAYSQWVEPDEFIQSQIDANATAIDNTNSEVSRVDGRVTTEANRITSLTGRVSTVEGQVATKAEAAALSSLTTRVTDVEGVNTSQGTAITNLENSVNSPTTGLATKASAQALTTLNNQVQHSTTGLSAVNSKVDTLKATVENPTTGLASKASSAALDTLSNKVNHSTTGLDAIANKTTVLEADVDSALKAVTVSDTRSTNQPPSWYLSYYPRRVVNEFKTQTAIGVGGFFGGTYCNLETKVYYPDLSGGDIIQTATSSADPSLYVQRRSNGTAAWTAWVQPIKDLRDSVATKAAASAVESLTTRVTTAEGTISSEATKLSNLTTTVGNHTTSIATQTSTIDGIQAKHTVKINNNGFVTGYGLISTANNGAVVSAFKVDADAFAVGKSGSGILPFVVTTAGQTISGITYPAAGTWINSAYIANATIGTAHIAELAVKSAQIDNLAVTTAKIGDAAITTAKIGDAEVKTLKIDGEAVTAISTVTYPMYVCARTYTANAQLTALIHALKPDYPSRVQGLLIGSPFASITVNPEGGGVQVDISTNAMWQSRVDGGAGGDSIYYLAVFLNGQLKVAQIDFIGNTSIPGQDNPYQARANSFVRFIFKGIPNGAKVEAYYAVAFAQIPNLYVMKARDLTVTVTSVKR